MARSRHWKNFHPAAGGKTAVCFILAWKLIFLKMEDRSLATSDFLNRNYFNNCLTSFTYLLAYLFL